LMHYAAFGIANRQKFILVTIGVIIVGVVYYGIVRAYKAREGVDISLAYAEIPPE